MKKLFFLFLLLNTCIYAQYGPEFKTFKALYPEDHSVRLNQKTDIYIKLDKNKLDVTQEFIEEDLYLDDSATYGSKKSINFSYFFELKEISASSYNYEKNKYVEKKVENFKEKDNLDQSFYDDSKSLNFIYPNLQKGSKSKLKYSEKIKNPRFLTPFYFGDLQPIANSRVRITANKNITLKFKEFYTENLDISFTKEEKKDNIIYTWELQNIEKYEYEENIPSFKKIIPHIIPIITSYKTKEGKETLLNDTSDLYNWYYSLVKDVNKEEGDTSLIELVNQITADKESDFDKVKAIYYWTQQNIKYIAYEYALGGFVPREANYVFKRKFGDCKDNSSILFKMLKIAGLEGNLTWIGTRDIPYGYSEVPTPIVDNHMILSYIDEEDNIYYLDATGRYTSIDYPSSFIQGKEALVSIDENNFRVEKVPIIEAQKNALIDSTNISIVETNIIGNSTTELKGYKKSDYLYSLEKKTTPSKIKEFYNGSFRKGNNKFLITDFVETNKFEYDKNLKVSYEFNIKDYLKKAGNEIYINLNLNKQLSYFKTKKDRKNEIEYDYKNYYEYNTTLKIPEGYTVEFIPDNVKAKNDYVSSSITYTHNNNQITYKHTVKLDFLSLNLTQQKEVNDLIKKVEKSYKEIIILKKI